MSHLGLQEFVASDKDEYVKKALEWAGKPEALAELRASMRQRFADSAMGQPALVGAALERALRIMWQRWCSGLAPQSFEVTRDEAESAKGGDE